MNSVHALTAENLLRALPEVLRNDESMEALATSIAQTLAKRPEEIQRLLIYPRIDELPEELLDILAYDFKVDWYDYNYSVESKRAIIKGCFFVHRKMGTRKSVENALSAIYPGTIVEEWFEYGGSPYYFRVILDVTSPREAIDNGKILRALNLYKPLRSHLEDDAIIYRSRVHLVINAACGYAIYSARRCGTYPQVSTRGGMARELVLVETADGQAVYASPTAGEIITGTHPQASTKGGKSDAAVIVEGLDGQVVYTVPATGEIITGTHPQTATMGEVVEGWLTFTETVGSVGVYARPCGRPLGAL